MGDAGSKTKAYEVDEHPFELRHEVKRLNARLDKIADSLEKSEFKDILENYTDPKKTDYYQSHGWHIQRSGIIARYLCHSGYTRLHSKPVPGCSCYWRIPWRN